MKKWLLGVGLLVIMGGLVIMMMTNKETKSPTLLVVEQDYYVYSYNPRIELSLYVNMKHHPITDENYIENVFIHSSDESKKMNLILEDLSLNHQETYLNQVFQNVTYQLLLSDFPAVFEIEEAYVTFRLSNQTIKKISIGYFYYDGSLENEILPYKTLHGEKQHSSKRQIHQVIVGLEDNIELLEVYLGKELVLFEKDNQVITITIPPTKYILVSFPLKVKYMKEGIEYIGQIEHYNYATLFNILELSEGLVKVYDLY